MKKTYPVEKTEAEWKALLSDQEYQILRKKGTEYPHTGEYNVFNAAGEYRCKGCNTELFKSDRKFDSGCGWPSFDQSIPGAIEYIKDTTHGMIRTETVCATCGGHLGHIFDDGPQHTTGQRYCINSASIRFNDEK